MMAAQRPLDRSSMPQIEIEPAPGGFAVNVAGKPLRFCDRELDAHHWGKHAFEAVQRGLRRPREIEEAMERLCLRATRYNLHR
jgi:hypothetical protein